MDEQSINLLERYRNGDENAAVEIFDRYVTRLVALASSKLSAGMRRRVEPDDIVQSAYRSFFRNADDGQFEVGNEFQLWGLLAAITVNKVRTHVKHHTAQKRDVYAETTATSSQSCYGLPPEDIAREPNGDDAAVLVEEYEVFLAGLSDFQRDVFELYLSGHSAEQIADSVKRSGRTIRRTLEDLRKRLEDRLH